MTWRRYVYRETPMRAGTTTLIRVQGDADEGGYDYVGM